MNNTPSFRMIPEEDELSKIERHLAFFPANPKQFHRLSPLQVEMYNRDGFLRPISLFDESEITDLRRYFDGLLEKVLQSGGDSYSISTAHMKHARVYDLLTDTRVVDCVSDLLGENVIGWGSHFFCKMPHDGKTVAWHQDASYWPLTPSKTVTVWLAIDDADHDNACVKFVGGSHLNGLITYRKSDPGEENVLDQTIENPEQYGTLAENILKAGEISIHSDLLLHGSDANNSDKRRCGLTLRYCTPDVTAHLDWNKKGVVVRGGDPTGHWGNPPRPENP
ncbi:MAG: phytanoyl-CoA dioxygenase family protein [Gemmataceae bacterium]